MTEVDKLASKLRKAYAKFRQPHSTLVPWNRAAEAKKEAWRVIAEAARRDLIGNRP